MSFLSQLMQVRKQDLQKASAEKLAAQLEREQAQEKGWRGISSVLSTIANVALPGVGGAITGALMNPLGRAFGAGGSSEDIHLSDRHKMYGGKKALETAKTGLDKSKSDYAKSALMGSALGFLGGEVGGKLLGKAGEAWKGSGVGKALTGIDESMTQGLMGLFESSPQIAEGIKGVSKSLAAPTIGNLYTQSKGTSAFDPSFSLLPESQYAPSTYQQGGMVQDKGLEEGDINYLKQLQDEELGAVNPMMQSSENENQWWNKLLATRPSYKQDEYERLSKGLPEKQSPFLNTLQGLYDVMRKDAEFKNGMIIPKFAAGGGIQVDEEQQSNTPNVPNVSNYFATQSEVGINDFLRTPAVASLINEARTGSPEAMANLVQMMRQMRPDMTEGKEDKDLSDMIGENLAAVDIYGQDYQDVVGGAQTTLQGLTGKAQAQRGQIASQAAQTGIRTGGGGFKGASTLSDQLYRKAEEEYKRMQTGITGAFDKSFGDFESMIGTLE